MANKAALSMYWSYSYPIAFSCSLNCTRVTPQFSIFFFLVYQAYIELRKGGLGDNVGQHAHALFDVGMLLEDEVVVQRPFPAKNEQ